MRYNYQLDSSTYLCLSRLHGVVQRYIKLELDQDDPDNLLISMGFTVSGYEVELGQRHLTSAEQIKFKPGDFKPLQKTL